MLLLPFLDTSTESSAPMYPSCWLWNQLAWGPTILNLDSEHGKEKRELLSHLSIMYFVIHFGLEAVYDSWHRITDIALLNHMETSFFFFFSLSQSTVVPKWRKPEVEWRAIMAITILKQNPFPFDPSRIPKFYTWFTQS